MKIKTAYCQMPIDCFLRFKYVILIDFDTLHFSIYAIKNPYTMTPCMINRIT